MSNFVVHHFCAKSDVNGNPQRVFVLENEYGMVAAWDEGYLGSDAVPGYLREDAYRAARVDVSVTCYKKFLKLPSPSYLQEVKGFANLQKF